MAQFDPPLLIVMSAGKRLVSEQPFGPIWVWARRNGMRRLFGIACFMASALLWHSIPLWAADDCLSCHAAGSGLTNSRGKSITVNADAVRTSVHKDSRCLDCHAGAVKFPHTAKTAGASCLACHAGVSQPLASSAHAGLGKPQTSEACVACHGDHNVLKPKVRGTQLCLSCHETEVREFSASLHGQARGRGNGEAPSCKDCHGPAHQVLAASDPNAAVSKVKLPETCGRCHSNPDLARKYLFTVAMPVEAYQSSVHGRAIRSGKMGAAACNDCHGVHNILPASDPRSPISKAKVATTCAQCHAQVFGIYKESIHGRAVAAGVKGAPTCIDCHGEHRILAPGDPGSPVYVANVSRLTCSHCHEDQRLLARLDLPAGRVESYEQSFHGLATRAGSRTAANCASCHGVHNILPSSDLRSTIAKANLPATCGKCHPDAGRKFALGPVHVVPTSAVGARVLYYVRLVYLFTIPTVVGLMVLHNLLDWLRKARRHLAQYRLAETGLRLTLNERLQHVLLLVSFVVLVVTGFALKFPESFWAAPIVAWEKNYPLRGLIHRIAAVVMTGASVYHVIYIAFTREGRRSLRGMLPKLRDMRDAIETIGYNLGYRRRLPLYAQFNYAEKMEYWSLVWGSVVMFLTGVLLWAHNLVLEYFPKWLIDVSTAIHYYEAILATLAVVIWHFYAVIFDPDVYPLKWTFVTGRAPAHEVREDVVERETGPVVPAKAAGDPSRSPTLSATRAETGDAVHSAEKPPGDKRAN